MESRPVRPPKGKYRRSIRLHDQNAAVASLATEPTTGAAPQQPHHHQPTLTNGDGTSPGGKGAAALTQDERPKKVAKKPASDAMLLKKNKALQGRISDLESALEQANGEKEGLEVALCDSESRRIELVEQVEYLEQELKDQGWRDESPSDYDDVWGNGRYCSGTEEEQESDTL